ncbi:MULTISPECIES: hypothetical protein [unclassified Luteococcus]|uniref:hypothetical protein n=1 Tax=unclassified Luteococcus TaxID=2639923 RepID=UPI00313B2D05
MSQFTQEEHETIRSGAMGAVALVSQAEPGFLATFKESMAASKALASAPADFVAVMKGGMTMPPTASSKEELVSKLLGNLREAVQVASKDPATAAALKNYVTAACEQVAVAAKGVSPEETAMIQQIQGVLNEAPTQAPTDPAASAQQNPADQAPPATEAPAQATPAAPQEQSAPEATAPEAQQAAPANGEGELKWPTQG